MRRFGAGGFALDASGPPQPAGDQARRLIGLVLLLAITAVAGAQYVSGPGLRPVPWLAVGPLLASVILSPRLTAALAGWALLLGVGLVLLEPALPGLPRPGVM